MSDLNPYVDFDNRKLTDESGAAFSLPPLVMSDKLNISLRGLRRTADGVRTVKLNLRSLKASLGPTMLPPASGGAKLRFGGTVDDPETDLVPYSANGTVLMEALTGVSPDWTPAEVVLEDVACWLVRFEEQVDAAPLQVGTENTLSPRSMVRVRAFQIYGVWWHEVRFLQAPLAFSNTYDEVLPPAPSIARLQEGGSESDSDDIIVNEIQQLTLPRTFRGTYVIKWNGRVSSILGIQDGPDEIAAAVNSMWADGVERFKGTNPEDDKANIEFVGPLGDAAQNLMTVEVKSFEPGSPTVVLDLETAEMDAAMRKTAALDKNTLVLNTGFEMELLYVEENEDPEDNDIPSRRLTVQLPATVSREQIYPELEAVAGIDWLRKQVAVDYIPFDPDQVVTGQQYYIVSLGNGADVAFAVTHGLDSEALLIAVRVNGSNGRLLGPTEYAVVFNSANQITITFAGTPPSAGGLQLIIACPMVESALRAHHHSVAQIDGLQAIIDDYGTRLGDLEELSPSGTIVRPDSSAPADEIDIPDVAVAVPGARLPAAADVAGLLEADTKTRAAFPAANIRPPGLLPAILDGTIDEISALPADPVAGNAYKNTGADPILIPGGLGRRGRTLKVNEFAGFDGRVWYHLTRASDTSNSFFPSDFEVELIPPITFEADTWRAGQMFALEFDLTLLLVRATTNAQWVLVIEHGTLPSESSPSPVAPNLQNVVWSATPLLTQRLVVSQLAQKRHFGCRVFRSSSNVITAEVLKQRAWFAADAAPATAQFALRARLVRFDTENSIAGAVGYAVAALTAGKASVS